MIESENFPRQTLSWRQKNKEWRKRCTKWGADRTYFNYNIVRKTVDQMMINYNLVNGKLHMSDLQLILNPDNIEANFIPDRIQHYPIINAKLQVLRGEESKRVFDYHVIITNPESISEIEQNKRDQVYKSLQEEIQNDSEDQEQFEKRMQKMGNYFNYEWQDFREQRANALLNHYVKEYNIPYLFNCGFMDAMTVGEEIYQIDIVGGEPVIQKLNPCKVRIFKSGFSNKVEDADVIIIEDYWSPGKVIDTYYDVLSPKDIKYIEEIPDATSAPITDEMDNIDERYGFIHSGFVGEEGTYTGEDIFNNTQFFTNNLMPYDLNGNVRVVKVYWKSKRKIKKVKHYDTETGEETYDFYTESYVCKKDMGEEEEIYWINEAWEGTLIGKDIFVNMRPRPIQYNRLNNPSRCHFGIVGSIYNFNDDKPFSMVDMMKPYNYMYDAIHDRLNKMIAKNWGKIITLDLAKVPKGWDIDKWLYYAKTNSMAIVDSFKEGNYGAATGKLAGALNNASSGVIDAELGNSIQSNIQLLQFIKEEMSDVVGISRQREGQISNRETVGGVERATLQSSHITEWLFMIHDDVKKRTLECLLETAKICMQGNTRKFQYLTSDSAQKIMDIDGDEFAENDYGLVVDNSNATQELSQKLDQLAQAGLQNQLITFSAMMKLYTSSSFAEKIRLIEATEQEQIKRKDEEMQMQKQLKEQEIQTLKETEQKKMYMQDKLNERDNETKIIVAELTAKAAAQSKQQPQEFTQGEQAKLAEQQRQFDVNTKLAYDKLALEEQKALSQVNLEIAKQNSKDRESSAKFQSQLDKFNADIQMKMRELDLDKDIFDMDQADQQHQHDMDFRNLELERERLRQDSEIRNRQIDKQAQKQTK